MPIMSSADPLNRLFTSLFTSGNPLGVETGLDRIIHFTALYILACQAAGWQNNIMLRSAKTLPY